MEFIKPPEAFIFDGPNVSQRWTRWAKQFETYYTAAELGSKGKNVQIAILLNAAGAEAQEVHEQFTFAETEDKEDYKLVLKKFDLYCRPRKNVVYDRHRFWSRNQCEEEPVDKWVKELRVIAKDCDFDTQEDNMIRDKIVFGVHDKRVQERMLRDGNLDLKKAVELCRAAESSKNQMAEIGKSPVAVNELKTSRESVNNVCDACDGSGCSRDGNQKAPQNANVKCFNCNIFGHYSRDCPEGDSFPRAKRRGRGRGRGRGRSSRNRGRGRRNFSEHELSTERTEEEYIQEFASLSLHSIEVSSTSESTETDVMPDVTQKSHQAEISNVTIEDGKIDEDEFLRDFATPTLLRSEESSINDHAEDRGSDTHPSSFSLHSIEVNSVSRKLDERTSKRYAKFLFHQPSKRETKEVPLKIDSGSERNALGLERFKTLYPEKVGPDGKPREEFMKKDDALLSAYGGTNVHHHGIIDIPVEYNSFKFMCPFYITNAKGDALLGLPTLEYLGIITINVVNEVEIADKSEKKKIDKPEKKKTETAEKEKSPEYISPSTPFDQRPSIQDKADLRKMYPECFDPSDKYWKDYQYDIKIDPDIEPKIHPPRRIPLELKSKFKAKLDEMVDRGILAKVNTPTKWVSSVLLRTKPNGDLRVCLDPTDLNKAIMRDHHPIPVVDDIIPELGNSDVFTKLDLKDGYWHVKLTEQSSFLTTFNTPFGRYRYLRMPFGLKMSQDVFQHKVEETYNSCAGTIGISDDITVHGKGESSHDHRLHEVMETTRRNNLCLNYEKVHVKKPSVKFFASIFSAEGMKADPDKIAAITALRPPETKTELKTFLGMVNYLQRFIPRPFSGQSENVHAVYQSLFQDLQKIRLHCVH